MDLQIRCAKLPAPVPEFRFHRGRQWRFDFAWPDHFRIALEVEGGTWSGGRHTRGQGYEDDCEKYNTAAIEGWLLIRATTDMVESGVALHDLRRAFAARGLE